MDCRKKNICRNKHSFECIGCIENNELDEEDRMWNGFSEKTKITDVINRVLKIV